MPEETSFVPVKDWAKKYISPDNELRDAILMEPDTMSRIEVGMKIESVPTQEQLKKVFSVAALDTRAASALMAFCGVRPQVVGSYRGMDGLMISDFVEAEVDNGSKQVTFKEIPTLVKVRRSISKAGHQYYTFMCEEGCDILKTYWEKRMGEAGTLAPDSPAVKPRAVNKKSKFLWAVRTSDRIKLAIRKAGFQWRRYVLRCFFDRQMLFQTAVHCSLS